MHNCSKKTILSLTTLKFQKVVLVMVTSMPVTDDSKKEVVLKKISYINYPV